MKQKIILINGDIGVGKSFLSNIFVQNGFTKESFAHTLKELAYTMMKEYFDGVVPEMIYGDYTAKKQRLQPCKDFRAINASLYFDYWLRCQKVSLLDDKTISECKVDFFKKISKPKITAREIMQYLGTEILRDRIHKDFHVLSFLDRTKGEGNNIVVDDFRFPNEYTILNRKRKFDTYTVKIEKDYKEKKDKNPHISENQDLHIDFTIKLGHDELVGEKHYQEIMDFINDN